MVNAQVWLDENYPVNGVSQNKDDSENYGKKGRKDITKLVISNKNLEENITLTDFPNLQILDISNNKLEHFYPAGENVRLVPYENSYFENNIIEEVYCSNNNFDTSWGWWKAEALRVLDHSNNKVKNYTLSARNLAYLNASNNELNKLDYHNLVRD